MCDIVLRESCWTWLGILQWTVHRQTRWRITGRAGKSSANEIRFQSGKFQCAQLMVSAIMFLTQTSRFNPFFLQRFNTASIAVWLGKILSGSLVFRLRGWKRITQIELCQCDRSGLYLGRLPTSPHCTPNLGPCPQPHWAVKVYEHTNERATSTLTSVLVFRPSAAKPGRRCGAMDILSFGGGGLEAPSQPGGQSRGGSTQEGGQPRGFQPRAWSCDGARPLRWVSVNLFTLEMYTSVGAWK